jgi:uncharacterized cupredoxin-like copper-binding protein
MRKLLGIQSRSSRGRWRTFSALLAAAAVGLTAWSLPAIAQPAKRAAVNASVVTVTAGKPTEFGFTLSKSSMLLVGKVTFKVTNVGAIGHSFKVCTKVAATANANSCVGVATKVLNKGQSQTLVVTLKMGKYEFLCTVAGHASGGMKGLLGAGVNVSAAETAVKVTTAPRRAAPKPVAGGCAARKTTVVNVRMADFAFSGVPGSIPCGKITFNETNTGVEDHNIAVAGKTPGPVIGAGESASFTLTLDPGTYSYQCDVGNHARQGMVGSFTVTG